MNSPITTVLEIDKNVETVPPVLSSLESSNTTFNDGVDVEQHNDEQDIPNEMVTDMVADNNEKSHNSETALSAAMKAQAPFEGNSIVDSESIQETFSQHRNKWESAARTMTPQGIIPQESKMRNERNRSPCKNRIKLVEKNLLGLDWSKSSNTSSIPAPSAFATDYSDHSSSAGSNSTNSSSISSSHILTTHHNLDEVDDIEVVSDYDILSMIESEPLSQSTSTSSTQSSDSSSECKYIIDEDSDKISPVIQSFDVDVHHESTTLDTLLEGNDNDEHMSAPSETHSTIQSQDYTNELAIQCEVPIIEDGEDDSLYDEVMEPTDTLHPQTSLEVDETTKLTNNADHALQPILVDELIPEHLLIHETIGNHESEDEPNQFKTEENEENKSKEIDKECSAEVTHSEAEDRSEIVHISSYQKASEKEFVAQIEDMNINDTGASAPSERQSNIPNMGSLVEEEEVDTFAIDEETTPCKMQTGISDDSSDEDPHNIVERPGSPYPCSSQHSQHSLKDEDSIAVFSDTTFPVSNVTKDSSEHEISNDMNMNMNMNVNVNVNLNEQGKIRTSDSFETDIQDIVVDSNDAQPTSPGSSMFPENIKIECWGDDLNNAPEMLNIEEVEANTGNKIVYNHRINHDAHEIIEIEHLDGIPFDWEPEIDYELMPHTDTSVDTCEHDREYDESSMTSSADGKRTTATADTELDDNLHLGLATVTATTTTTATATVRANLLPNADHVQNTGIIFTRTSWRSLLMRKWQRSVWVHYGAGAVYLFRSEEDVNTWLNDATLTTKERDALIKVKLDFLSEIRKPNVRGYKLTSTKAKIYEKNGPVYFNFKIEKWLELDKHISGAFASPNREEVETFRSVVTSCLDNCPYNGLKSIKDLLIEEKTDRYPTVRNTLASKLRHKD